MGIGAVEIVAPAMMMGTYNGLLNTSGSPYYDLVAVADGGL